MFKGLSSLLFLSYPFFTLLLGLGLSTMLNRHQAALILFELISIKGRRI